MKRDVTASGERIRPMPDPKKPRKSAKRPELKIEVPKVSKQELAELLLTLNHTGQRLDRRLRSIETARDTGTAAFRRRFRFFAADIVNAQTAILVAVAALLQVQINIKEAFGEE